LPALETDRSRRHLPSRDGAPFAGPEFIDPTIAKGAHAMNQLLARTGLFDDFFKDVAPGFYVRPLHGDSLPSPSQIKIDVKETPSAYTVVAEVPGVAKEDIQVTVEGGVVTLRAEIKQQDSQTQDEKVLRTERYYGATARSFQLASEIDNERAKARYENGVLTLTLPKKLAAAGHRLAVE
jgi:HSP20 family protein